MTTSYLQQALFQFYLLGRVQALLGGAPSVVVAVVNGLLFGVLHLPDWDLTVVHHRRGQRMELVLPT